MMSNMEIFDRIFLSSKFSIKYNDLKTIIAARQFSLSSSPGITISPDWDYLLLTGSLLAQSKHSHHHLAALRIAQECMQCEKNETRKAAATIILHSLTNTPSIDLARKRRLISSETESRIVGPLKCDWLRRSQEYTHFDTQCIPQRINRFQKSFLNAVDRHKWLSVSAPTSAGKSFIVLQWIASVIDSENVNNIVYIVPTRALIQQVELDFKEYFLSRGRKDVLVTSMPMKSTKSDGPRIFIFTQERLHLMMFSMNNDDFSCDVMIVDEAHKVGDRSRGILLQLVIEEIVNLYRQSRVVFISPMTSNPEILLQDAPAGATKAMIRSEQAMVNQNLFWAISKRSTIWDLSLCREDDIVPIGSFELPYRPTTVAKRVAFVSHTLGAKDSGNLIYANRASDAEDISRILYELRFDFDISSNEMITDLSDLIKEQIHEDYSLRYFITRGVAFHYGNMPLMVRTIIERLFKLGIIPYLVCTSTLIEGVNLPAKNIFLRGPKKGIKHAMPESDFWNLAGRAGRLGKEFDGNIVCIDPLVKGVWKNEPPRQKMLYPITRSSDISISRFDELSKFALSDTPRNTASAEPELEYAFSYFMLRFLEDGLLENPALSNKYPRSFLVEVNSLMSKCVEKCKRVPIDIIRRNPGISPIAMAILRDVLLASIDSIEDLIPPVPEDDSSYLGYVEIIKHISRNLSGDHLAISDARAVLVTQWMRGFTLPRIIKDRIIYYERKKKSSRSRASIIREVMEDVEEYARFKFPKFIACYNDLLRDVLIESGRPELVEKIPNDIGLWLEYGALSGTQITLMNLGLTRMSAIAVAALILQEDFHEKECLLWMSRQDWNAIDISPFIVEEVKENLSIHGIEWNSLSSIL
jgi:hypothetical protein